MCTHFTYDSPRWASSYTQTNTYSEFIRSRLPGATHTLNASGALLGSLGMGPGRVRICSPDFKQKQEYLYTEFISMQNSVKREICFWRFKFYHICYFSIYPLYI